MTLKEAKKILKKEGFILSLASKVINQTGAIREFEKPEVCEAIKVANANKWTIGLSPIEWNEREKRLKKEHEKNNKESAHDKKSMTLEEAKDMLMKEVFKLEGPGKLYDVSECFIELESPEICEAMQIVCSAGYMIMMEVCDFNARKARLKEQLEEHSNAPTSGSPALEEAASQFNDALLDEQGKKIKHLTKKISRLNKIIHKKNLKIEEFRKESSRFLRGKIKMFGENMDLEGKLKDKDAVLSDVTEELRLTKIREKNLTEVCQKYVKENEKLKKKLAEKIVDKIDAQALKSAESALAYKEKVIAEKDEVIADLGNELAATKKELEEKTHLVDIIRNASKEYCDYGVAANEFIKELASLYVIANDKGIINDEMLERCKNYQTYGFPANCNRETKKEINDIARGNENKKLSLFRDDSVGAVTNQKDCSSAKDTHPAVDIAEEGADRSGVIVLCGKDFVKKYKEIIEELSKVADDIIDQFLLFGEIIIKEEK